jgi:ABC-type lipoprotein release transport system permease subunit
MTLLRMIVREVTRAKVNTLLCLVTVIMATGLLVAMIASARASVDATRRGMKALGFNLLITPPEVDTARYQALDFEQGDMPEEYISRLAESTALAQHFVGKYQKTVQVEGCTVVLTGVLPEVTKVGTQMRPMPTAHVVPEGKVFLGFGAASALDKSPGDAIELLGRTFTVEKVFPERGVSPDDIRVFAHLHDVQALVGKPGRVNAIDALACYCPVDVDDILGALEKGVKDVLPDVNVKPYKSILLGRQKQRELVYQLQQVTLAIVIAASAVAIWGLTHQNVRNRRKEIGVLRALGLPEWRIAALFVGKILAYSILGTIIGCLSGYAAAAWVNLGGRPVGMPGDILAVLMFATPVAAVLFGTPPILSGLLQEPTEVLRDTVA